MGKKKMCEICHKNSDEVPDREEIRPVIAAAPAMMEALVGAKWAMESYISKQLLEQMDEYKDVVKALRKARGEEIEANGFLIEAAPDMLKALVEVKMRIEEYITTCPLCGESAERGHKYYCLWHVANDAIRKARGERYCHSEYGSENCKWEPGIGCTPKCPECIP